jgi:HAE1 family hydrophobic/amphiphilic exporter-1
LLSASLPLAVFAQDGIVASQKPSSLQSQQKVKPTAALTASGDVKATEPAPADKPADKKDGVVVEVVATETTQQPQSPTTTTQGEQNPITQPLALSPEVTRQRVGVVEGQRESLTLQDSIAMALRNNLEIEVNRESVQMARFNLFAARGFYDITTSFESGYRSATRPTASIFGGGGDSGAVTDKSLYYNLQTIKQIESTGGNLLLQLDNSRSTTSATFAQLETQYNNNLTFTFTQPLMRNFSIDQNRRNIQILRRSLDLSDSQFRQNVIEVINRVQRAYWDLVFAIRNEQVARDAVELARVQLENNRRMVEAGTLAPIELRETEAQLESSKEQVIVALQNITTAENTLKGLILKDPNERLWSSEIVPADEPAFGQPTFSLDEAVGLALKNRPELDQIRLQAEQNDFDIKYFRNQTKPQVDFVGIYTNTGLAGTPSTVLGNDGRPVGENVLDRFRGGLFQSFRNLFGQDFRTYQAGIRFSFPWRNRTAEGNLGSALAEARQLDARQRQLVQNVNIEVRNALQAVQAGKQRFEAARANRIAAEAQLRGEMEKFRAGLSSNFLVLQRQTDLASARGSEVRALTDFNKALADLQRVTGMTLLNNNVEVSPMATIK